MLQKDYHTLFLIYHIVICEGKMNMEKFYLGLNDKRIKEVGEILTLEKKEVFDFESNLDKIEEGDVVILSPAYKWREEVIAKLPKNILVFGSKVREELKGYLEGIKYVSLMDIEDFVIDNAKLTAENFLVDLIQNTDLSIYEQKILILGNGRVAKALWYLFLKLNVSFDAAMRRKDEYNLSKLIAGKSFLFDDVRKNLYEYDIVINTIPEVIFKDDTEFKEGCVLFELASINCIENVKRIKYVLCPALPAKYSPKSAGRLIINEVRKILKGEKI